MRELFRLKVASKRQVTIPQRLLNVLQLGEGDEIRLEVENGQIVLAEPCKVIPTRLFTPEVLTQLSKRQAEMDQGDTVALDPEKLLEDAQASEVAVVERMEAVGVR